MSGMVCLEIVILQIGFLRNQDAFSMQAVYAGVSLRAKDEEGKDRWGEKSRLDGGTITHQYNSREDTERQWSFRMVPGSPRALHFPHGSVFEAGLQIG